MKGRKHRQHLPLPPLPKLCPDVGVPRCFCFPGKAQVICPLGLAKDGTHSLSAAEILRKHFGLPPPPKLKEASKRFGHKILETVSKSEQEKTWYFDVWNKVGCVSKRWRVVAWSLAESISGLPDL